MCVGGVHTYMCFVEYQSVFIYQIIGMQKIVYVWQGSTFVYRHGRDRHDKNVLEANGVHVGL